MNRQLLLFLLGFSFVGQSQAADLRTLYEQNEGSVVMIESIDPFGNPLKTGTGFYIADGCMIATNYHVIRGAYRLSVSTERRVVTEDDPRILVDKEYDIALIISKNCGKALQITKLEPKIGQEVFAIGNPQGLEKSLSVGIVSGIRKGKYTLIQTTTSISQGSSGSPLLNTDGQVIGITTFYLAKGQNLNFAVPAIEIERISGSKEKPLQLNQDGIDLSDPLTVATAFFSHLRDKNILKAVALVEPGFQAGFQKAMLAEPPNIPNKAKLYLEHAPEFEGQQRASVDVGGTGIGVDLVKIGDRWWVTK